MKKKYIIPAVIFTALFVWSETISNTGLNKLIPKPLQQISFTAKAEKIVSSGEIFQITYTVNEVANGFKGPVFKGLTLISGPNTMTSQSYSYVNGQTTQQISTTFTYHLTAQTPGTYTIPPAQVTVDGKTYSSEKLTITVVQGKTKNNGTNNPQTENGETVDISKDVFIKTSYSKTSVFQGEHIIATTKLYTRIDIRNISQLSAPKYTGFWVKDIKSPQNLVGEREIYNGQIYSAALLKQTIIFPQKIGKYTIEPFETEISVKQKVGKEYDFFGRIVDRYAYVTHKIKSNAQTITVKPFPEETPENFSGIVGKNFSIKAETDKVKLKTDENLNYNIKITGNGNLYLLNEINFSVPEAFDSYKPNIDEQIKYSENGAPGYKEFKYILLARKYGKTKILPVNFVYFNTESQKFEEIRSAEFEITIDKGENYSTIANQGVQVINKDIRYIKQKNANFKPINSHFGGSLWFYLSYIIAVAAFTTFVLIRRKTIKENSDIARMRNKKAAKVSQKRLKTALELLNAKKETEFYAEINKSLTGYLADKFNLSQNLTTKNEIEEILLQKGLEKDFTDSVINIINTCEYAQYGPVRNNLTPENVYFETEQIINKLESVL